GLVSMWALLSTGSSGTGLWARTLQGQQQASTPLTGIALDVPHSFRIVPGASGGDHYVDGVLGASHPIFLTQRPYAYASNNGPGQLSLDWLRVGSYPAGSADYLSCSYDLGDLARWDGLYWRAGVPAGTSLAFSTRSSLDGQSWSDWAAVAEA